MVIKDFVKGLKLFLFVAIIYILIMLAPAIQRTIMAVLEINIPYPLFIIINLLALVLSIYLTSKIYNKLKNWINK